MTAIAGLVADGRVWIGGDSAGTAGYSQAVRADAKVFTNGPYLFGFTSSFRMGQLLRYTLKPPTPRTEERDVYGFLVVEFVDAVRKCLKAGGFAETHDNVETGGTFLLGIRGGLYCIESDYQVGIPACGYEAVGCGDHLALGSLHTSADTGWSPRVRVKAALDAASTFSTDVAPPYVIRSIA